MNSFRKKKSNSNWTAAAAAAEKHKNNTQYNCLVSIEIDVCALVASNLEPERLTVFYCGARLAQWQYTHNNRHSDNTMMTESHEHTIQNNGGNDVDVDERKRKSYAK